MCGATVKPPSYLYVLYLFNLYIVCTGNVFQCVTFADDGDSTLFLCVLCHGLMLDKDGYITDTRALLRCSSCSMFSLVRPLIEICTRTTYTHVMGTGF